MEEVDLSDNSASPKSWFLVGNYVPRETARCQQSRIFRGLQGEGRGSRMEESVFFVLRAQPTKQFELYQK